MMCLVACSFCSLSSCTASNGTTGDDEDSESYVDLGLSSGTKWKNVNEKNEAALRSDFFTYKEATDRYGDKLPSDEQFIELVNECQWTWMGMGYKIVGPNGAGITLPAAGSINGYGGVIWVGTHGRYWSSSPVDIEDTVYILFGSNFEFDSGNVRRSDPLAIFEHSSVRLVQD